MGSAMPWIELVLYISPDAMLSSKARRTMESLLAQYDPTHIRFTVCDVSKEPAAAELDHITFTPALVRRFPEPRAWILGDLEDTSEVTRILVAAGVRKTSELTIPRSVRPRLPLAERIPLGETPAPQDPRSSRDR